MAFNWRSLVFKQSAAQSAAVVEPTIGNPIAVPVVAAATPAANDRRRRGAENPYLNYRRRWNDHTGSILSQRNMWMLFALAAMLIALAAVGGLISVSQKSKFVPYVVEVDKLGQAVANHALQQAQPVDERIIKSSLAEFITSARMVTFDVQLQRQAVFKVYSRLATGDPATIKMNEFLNGNPELNPFKRAQKETASIEIVSILQQTPQTWQIDWMESVRDRKGGLTSDPFRMRALVNISIIQPTEETTEKQLRDNPLGIFVVDFNWSRTLN